MNSHNNDLEDLNEPDLTHPDDRDDQDDYDDQDDSDDQDDDGPSTIVYYDIDDAQDEQDDDSDKDAPRNPAVKPPQGRGLRSLPAVAEEEEELPPSKTKIKKQMHELQDLGEELVELSKDQLAKLVLPETLHLAIREMSKINKFGARRRQMQYIGKLMRDVDTAPITAQLDIWKGVSQQHIGYMHQLERWRERLLENDAALTELLTAYPETDVQRLRTLIRNAIKERELGKPAKNFREIFLVLRETIPVTM